MSARQEFVILNAIARQFAEGYVEGGSKVLAIM
jgi:hypothetical protein